MKSTFEIAHKELRTIFYSPVGWLVLAVIAMEVSTQLFHSITVRSIQAGGSDIVLSLTYLLLFDYTYAPAGLVQKMLNHLYLFIPLITMGLLSQEYSKGTIKLLFSSPVQVGDIVFGKFLAVMVYGLMLTAVLGLFELLIGIFIVQSMDLHVALWALLMTYLMICLYGAVGLFVSSLTPYPFVAALGSVGMLFALQYVSGLVEVGGSMPPMVADMLQWFSILKMFESFFVGFISAWQVLYFPLVIVLFLGLAYLRLYSMRQSESLWTKFRRYAALIAIVLSIGMLSVPALKAYYTNIRSEHPKDTRILIDENDVPTWRPILLYGVPASVLLLGSIVVVRRRWQ